MFDIGADELLLTAVVAVVVIGPKDLPRALRTVGRWVAKMRRMSNAFRAGIENVIREAELEEMEREWRERNAQIMAAHPTATADAESAVAAAAAHGEPLALPLTAPVAGEVPVAEVATASTVPVPTEPPAAAPPSETGR